MSRSRFPNISAGFLAPFAKEEVKQRTGKSGQPFDYVTARTVMNRFDDIVGWDNWWDEYREIADGVLCRITVRLPDGHLISKEDAGGYPDSHGLSEEDTEKAGYSDAFKRAAVKFGVGRYLYQDGVPSFYWDCGNDMNVERYPDLSATAVPGSAVGRSAMGDPRRAAPASSSPASSAPAPPAGPAASRPAASGGPGPAGAAAAPPPRSSGGYGPPRTGKQLYAWAASTQTKYTRERLPLLDWVLDRAKQLGWPERTDSWTQPQVEDAFRWAVAQVIHFFPSYDGPRPGGSVASPPADLAGAVQGQIQGAPAAPNVPPWHDSSAPQGGSPLPDSSIPY